MQLVIYVSIVHTDVKTVATRDEAELFVLNFSAACHD
jgi:hypothetical protein